MRIDPRSAAITVAVVAVLWYFVGAVVNALSPWGAAALVSYIFHVDLIKLARPFAWDSFAVGVLVCGAGGAFWGYVGAHLYNRLSKPVAAP